MDDLIAFLRARLDEDDQTARAAGAELGPDWLYDAERGWVRAAREGDGIATGHQEFLDSEHGHHIARHDPARVLAEVDAKRQMVALHGPVILRAGGGAAHFDTTRVCRSCEPPKQFPETAWPCPTLRLVALPYADHPDYQDAWRP
ncbi:DUF6221 family protein [Streptomyces zaomyceticus]|uniref:DUF6221 family protein n=1 Tax=Streptomyces zaomyceticus TaxID=68286 RepID=UPI0033B8A36F